VKNNQVLVVYELAVSEANEVRKIYVFRKQACMYSRYILV